MQGERVTLSVPCGNCGRVHAVPARRAGGVTEYYAPACSECGWWNVFESPRGQPILIDRATFRVWRDQMNDPRRAVEASELASLRHEVRALRRAVGGGQGEALPT